MVGLGLKNIFKNLVSWQRSRKWHQGYKLWRLIDMIESILKTKDLQSRQALIASTLNYTKKTLPGLYDETKFMLENSLALYIQGKTQEADDILANDLDHFLFIYEQFVLCVPDSDDWYCKSCQMWNPAKKNCKGCLSSNALPVSA